MKTNNIRPYTLLLAILAGISVFVTGCGKMDETFREFIKDGRIVYAPTPGDSLKVHPGRNRVQLSWPAAPDPKVSEARIYWNNRLDSLIANIKNPPNDTVRITIADLPEGTYLFEIYIFDDFGNRSIKSDFVANTYGTQYQQSLLVRPVNEAIYDADSVVVTWGSNSNEQAYYSEIAYTDLDGNEQVARVRPADERSILRDFALTDSIAFRTAYLPNPLALDTFYTEWHQHKVLGPPVEFDRADWSAEASSFDIRPGANYRPGSNTLDGDANTLWVNEIGPDFSYPHTLTINMGSMYDDVYGITILTRLGAASRPKDIRLYTSIDGEEWIPPGGLWELENIGDKQFLFFSDPVQAQYFRIEALNAHDGGVNIAVAEVGAFTR